MATSCCGEESLCLGRKGGKQRAESCAVCLSDGPLDFPQKVVGGPKNRECELINPNSRELLLIKDLPGLYNYSRVKVRHYDWKLKVVFIELCDLLVVRRVLCKSG